MRERERERERESNFLSSEFIRKIKKILKQLIPPIIFSFIKNKTNNPIYNTYAEALKDCQDGYESSDLVEVVVEKNKRFNISIKNNPILDLGILRTIIGIGLVKNKSKLSVIDFGGAGGFHYTIAKIALGNETVLNWSVVETTAMMKKAKQLENNELKFYDSIDLAQKELVNVDLVFTSGALQCCPNPTESLEQLININAKYIFITRTAFNNSTSEIISTQISNLSENGVGPLPIGYKNKKLKYPVTFMSKTLVENMLSKKYNIRFTIVEDKETYRVLNKTFDMYGYFCVRKI
jgi:putative methyltransferase (TIGR04325 family)